MPPWALPEIREMSHLGRLYASLNYSLATEIAQAYGARTKQLMTSSISSLNCVRNAPGDHTRLFDRKLVAAPCRPKPDIVPALDHLRDETSAKAAFGLYTAFAITVFLMQSIDTHNQWPQASSTFSETSPNSPDSQPAQWASPRTGPAINYGTQESSPPNGFVGVKLTRASEVR